MAAFGLIMTVIAFIYGLFVRSSLMKADKINEQRKVDEILEKAKQRTEAVVKPLSDAELAERFNSDISTKHSDK